MPNADGRDDAHHQSGVLTVTSIVILMVTLMESPAPSPAEMPTPRHDIELPEPPPGDYPSQTPPEEVPPPGTPQRKT